MAATGSGTAIQAFSVPVTMASNSPIHVTNNPLALPDLKFSSNDAAGNYGSIRIIPTSSTTGTATWTYPSLTTQDYVTIYAFPISAPSNITPLASGSGYVTTPGSYVANVTLPSGDTWSNTGIKMTTLQFAVSQLPEVPWAAGLPLLLALPFGYSLWRRRTQPAS